MKLKSLVASVAAACAAASLGGCYVVPVDHRPSTVYVPAPAPVAASAPVPAPIQVRLYPSNEMASKTGPLTAVVIDNANGHGTFQLHYAGEYLTGEATRLRPGQGIANAASSGGTFVKCNYTITANSRGIGNCNFSNGAQYQLHFGS